jgi:hypothetical protein
MSVTQAHVSHIFKQPSVAQGLVQTLQLVCVPSRTPIRVRITTHAVNLLSHHADVIGHSGHRLKGLVGCLAV